MLQSCESIVGFYRRWRHRSWYLRQSGRAGSRSERTDTSGTYVSQRSSRRTVHHSTHVMMTQLCLEMSQRMRMTLKTRMNHTNGMRNIGADPMNFAHIMTDVWIQTVLHTTRRWIIIFPLTIVVTSARLCPGRWSFCRFSCCWWRLTIRIFSAYVLRVR